jgi:acetyl/propionyl-CoA carboxylase alpha subunit
VLLKASAGGGGKGMRTVYDASKYVFSFFIHSSEDLCSPAFLSLKSEIEAAKGESLRAFGSDQLLIEKYFTSVRHVEVCRVPSFHMRVVGQIENGFAEFPSRYIGSNFW